MRPSSCSASGSSVFAPASSTRISLWRTDVIRRLLRTTALVASGVWLSALTVLAQTQEPPSTFKKMADSDLAREQLPATPLVFTAYAFVWLALLTYVFF